MASIALKSSFSHTLCTLGEDEVLESILHRKRRIDVDFSHFFRPPDSLKSGEKSELLKSGKSCFFDIKQNPLPQYLQRLAGICGGWSGARTLDTLLAKALFTRCYRMPPAETFVGRISTLEIQDVCSRVLISIHVSNISSQIKIAKSKKAKSD